MIRLLKMAGIAATAMVFGFGLAAPANAQATRTWISGVGDDVNPCSRTAPCKTWAGAIPKTAAGGEIDCLDPGGFGSVTITKSITLDCGEGQGGSAGGILNSGVSGVIINDPNGGTAPTIKVVLRNLTIDGAGVTVGTYGVRFLGGKSLTMQNVLISNQGTGGVAAVSFEPQAGSVGAQLVMTDVSITNGIGAGISVASGGGVAVTAVLNRVTVSDTTTGLLVQDGGTATVTNSNFTNNTVNGVQTLFTSVTSTINLDHVTLAGNATGIYAGTSSLIRISDVGVYGGIRGLKVQGTGLIQSFGNNRIGPNAGAPGAPTSTVPQQ